MYLFGKLIMSSILVSSISVIYTIVSFVLRDTRKFMPSISEAGAFPGNHLVYASGMTIGAITMAIGLFMFIHQAYTLTNGKEISVSKFDYFVAVVGTCFMTYSMAYQGISKIKLNTDDCAHRKAASAFFISALIMCFFYTNMYNVAFKNTRSIIRWLMFVSIIVNIYLQQKVTSAFDFHISTTKNIQQMPLKFINSFSILQYFFVGSLFTILGTLIK